MGTDTWVASGQVFEGKPTWGGGLAADSRRIVLVRGGGAGQEQSMYVCGGSIQRSVIKTIPARQLFCCFFLATKYSQCSGAFFQEQLF